MCGRFSRIPCPIFVIFWLTLVLTAWVALGVYDHIPGETGAVPETFTERISRTTDHQKPLLLVFLHPRCPCSRNTLMEFEKLLARHPGTFELRFYFVHPADTAADWYLGENWDRARAIPLAHVEVDSNGKLAKSLGVRTSGHVLGYAPDGRLLFSGGLSEARSGHHAGEGGRMLENAMMETDHPPVRTSVFGCRLLNDRELND